MSDTDQMNDQEQGNVQADNNAMAVGRDVVVSDVQNSSVHIGNIIHTYVNSQDKPADLSEPIKSKPFEPETIFIQEGEFWMGNPAREGTSQFDYPQQKVFLPAFKIGKYPVTNREFEFYVRQKKISIPNPRAMNWDGQQVRPGTEKHPVTGVTWEEAMAYCRWLTEYTGREYTLPTEAQWEKACRGDGKTIYPWGDEPISGRSNQGQSRLANVDAYSAQGSYECHDLVGNVRQWTCTLWGKNENEPDIRFGPSWVDDDGRNNLEETILVWRVVRGSSFEDEPALQRCSARSGDSIISRGNPRYGFRVARLK